MGCVWSKQRPLTKEEIAELYQRNFEQAPLTDNQTQMESEEVNIKKSSKKQKNDQTPLVQNSKKSINDQRIQNVKVENRLSHVTTDVREVQSQQLKDQHSQRSVAQLQSQPVIRQNIGVVQQNNEISSNISNSKQELQLKQFQQKQEEVEHKEQKQVNNGLREHYLIIKYFEIQQNNQTIRKRSFAFIKQKGYFSMFDIDLIITRLIINDGKLSLKTNIQWLLRVYNQIIIDIQACQNPQDPNYEIQRQIILPDICEQLLELIGQHLITLLINTKVYQIQQMNEKRDVLQDQNNQIADEIYEQIFSQQVREINNNILHQFLKYLNNEGKDNHRTIILDLMLKRELKINNKIDLTNNSVQLKSLELLQNIAEYPLLVEPLLLNSWGFVKIESMKTGKNVQNNTIIGRVLSYSSFPKESDQSNTLLDIFNQNSIDGYRVKIMQVTDAIIQLFRKLMIQSQTRESTFKLIKHIIFVNLDTEKIQSPILLMNCSTSGFIHNFTHVLLSLTYEFIELSKDIFMQSKQLDQSIILSIMNHHPLMSNIYKQDMQQNSQLNSSKMNLMQMNPRTNLITIMYLFTQRALKLQIYTLEIYMKFQLGATFNNLEKSMLKLRYAYNVQLMDQETVKNTMRFLCLQSRIALNQIQLDQPKQYEVILPDIFMLTCHSFIRHYMINNELTDIFYNEVQTICELMCYIICNGYLIKSVEIRGFALKIIYFVSLLRQVQRRMNTNVLKLMDLFIENQVIVNHLIKGLINIYIDTEQYSQDNRGSQRFVFCQIINYLFQFHPKIYIQKLNQLALEQKTIVIHFIDIYLEAYIDIFNQCLEKMKRMKQFENVIDNFNEQDGEYQDQLSQLRKLSDHLDEYQQHIFIFHEQLFQAFIRDEIGVKYVGHLNDVIMKLSGPYSHIYKTRKLNEVKFDFKMQQSTVVKIIIVQSHHQLFLEEMVKDRLQFIQQNRFFSIDLLKHLKNTFYWENTLPLNKILEFDIVIMKLMKLSNINSDYETLQQGAPKEFLDSITTNLMTEPVQLPSSKFIMDRLTIQKLLSENQIDPYDQSYLTEDMVIELPQIKQRISEFILDKMCKIQKNHDLEVYLDDQIRQLDNIPEQFKDALNQRLMHDPYTLPLSKKNIDRATMDELFQNSHNINDPINNTNLNKNMMIENVALKKQIQAYLESERNYLKKKIKVKEAEEERLSQQFIKEQQQNQQAQQVLNLIQNQNPQDFMIQNIDNQMNPEEFQDKLLSQAFQINTLNQTIINIHCPFVMHNSKLSVDIMIDQLIVNVLTKYDDFTTQMKINWLLQALHDLIVQKDKYNMQDIQLAQFNQIINGICSFLITLILYPQTFGIQQTNEDKDAHQDLWNTIASLVYLSIFDQSQGNFKVTVLRTFLEYLSQHIHVEETTKILDLMLKRELTNCTNINIFNNTPQRRALEIIHEIANYPILIEPLILNSWAFVKVDKMKTGKQIQNYSIIGRALSITTFPQECSQLNFLKPAQIQEHIQVIRLSMSCVLDSIARLFKRLLGINTTKSKLLTLFNHILYVNLKMNIDQLEHSNNYSTCGFINNLIQVLLRLCSAFTSSKDIIQLKSIEINNNSIVATQQHPLLANLYDNQQHQNLLQNQDNQNQFKPQLMTFFYLFTLRAMNLQNQTIQKYKKLQANLEDVQLQNKYQHQRLIQQKQGYDVSLFDQSSIRYTVQLLCFECGVIQNQLKDQFTYEQSLIIYIEDLYNMISFYHSSCDLSAFLNEIGMICEVIVLIIRYDYLTKSNIIRYKGIYLLASLLSHNQQINQGNSELWRIFVESRLIQENLFKALYLVFYENYSKSIGDIENCNKAIHQITGYLLENHQHIYGQNLIYTFIHNKGLFDQYVASTKCSYLILSLIIMGKSAQLLQQTNKRDLEYEQAIKIKYELSSRFYLNFKILTSLAKDLFKTDEVRQILAQNLNFMIGLINDLQKAPFFKQFQETIKVELTTIIASIVEIYINLGTDDLFLKQIVSDKQSFSLYFFQGIMNQAKNNNMLNANKLMNFQNIIDKISRIMRY